MRRKRDERAFSFLHRSIRSSPLPMGDQEFETQRRFLHKDPNNGSQDIFFLSLLLYMLYTFCFFSAFPFNFPLLEGGGGGGIGLLNEAGNFDFSERPAGSKTTKVTLISFRACLAFTCRMVEYVTHMQGFSYTLSKNKCHGSARRAPYDEINKRKDAPSILYNIDGSI